MSKKSRLKGQPKPTGRFPWLGVVGGGAVLLIVAGLAFWWSASSSSSATTPQVDGTPKLVVDQTSVDEGDVKLGTMVQTTFRLRNTGTQPLQILGEPQVQLVQGC